MKEDDEFAQHSIPANAPKDEQTLEPVICHNTTHIAEPGDSLAMKNSENGSLSTPTANTNPLSDTGPSLGTNASSVPNGCANHEQTNVSNEMGRGGICLLIPGLRPTPFIVPLRSCHTWDASTP